MPGRSSNLDRVEDHVDDRRNEEQSQIHVHDELPRTADGRITPEPVRTQEGEPSNYCFTLLVMSLGKRSNELLTPVVANECSVMFVYIFARKNK